jgi:hypothetical protein
MIADTSVIQLGGAFCFGGIIGWYVFLIGRNLKEGMQLSHLTAIIGIIGGGAVLSLFPLASDLFGAYGIGLGFGFMYSLFFNFRR